MSLISGLINRVGLRISHPKVFNSVYFFYRLLFCKRFINIKLENKSYIIFNLSFSIEYWLGSCILWISMKLFRSQNLYLGFSESSISIVLSRRYPVVIILWRDNFNRRIKQISSNLKRFTLDIETKLSRLTNLISILWIFTDYFNSHLISRENFN